MIANFVINFILILKIINKMSILAKGSLFMWV